MVILSFFELFEDFRVLLAASGIIFVLIAIIGRFKTKYFEFNASSILQRMALLLVGAILLGSVLIPIFNSNSNDSDKIKRILAQRIEQLVQEGQSFTNDDQGQTFNYQDWKNRSLQLLDLVDNILETKYRDEFKEFTDHSPSQVFLNVSSVRNGIIILRAVRVILLS